MPLGTLDRTPPPFFKQGPSALSKLMVCSALALFLMVADTRFKITQPVRSTVAMVLFPVQWLAMRPVLAARWVGDYFGGLHHARSTEEDARRKLILQAQRANQVEQLHDRERAVAQAAGPARAPEHAVDRGRSAVRRGRSLHPQGDHRQGPGPGHRRRLAGDRRVRRAGPGDPRAPADQRGDAGDRPRPGHPHASTPAPAPAASRTATPARTARRARTALHGRQRRRAARRPAHHQRRRRRLSAGHSRWPRWKGGAPARFGLRPHLPANRRRWWTARAT
jgi:hypothetical protein